MKLLRKNTSVYDQFAYGTAKTKQGTGFKVDVNPVSDGSEKRHFSLLKNTFLKQKHRADYSPKNCNSSTFRGKLDSAMDLNSYFEGKL